MERERQYVLFNIAILAFNLYICMLILEYTWMDVWGLESGTKAEMLNGKGKLVDHR